MYVFLTVLMILVLPFQSLAYEPKRADENLATDFATCTAYFGFIRQDARFTNDPQVIEAMTRSYVSAIQLSNEKVTTARIIFDAQSIMEDVDYRLSNAAIVINKYGRFCQQLLENPEARRQYWLRK